MMTMVIKLVKILKKDDDHIIYDNDGDNDEKDDDKCDDEVTRYR